jgi:hypothetical protein
LIQALCFAEIAELKLCWHKKIKLKRYRQGDNIGLEVAKKDYLEKFEKEVPVNKKNDFVDFGKTKRIEETIFVLVRA